MSNLKTRIERLEQIRVSDDIPYLSFTSDEWDALTEQERAECARHKVYVGVSPDDWDDDAPGADARVRTRVENDGEQ